MYFGEYGSTPLCSIKIVLLGRSSSFTKGFSLKGGGTGTAPKGVPTPFWLAPNLQGLSLSFCK